MTFTIVIVVGGAQNVMASTLSFSIPHKLGRAEAQRRIAEALETSAHRFADLPNAKLSTQWNGDNLSFNAEVNGQTATGHLDVRDREVVVQMALSDLLDGFGVYIRGRLKQQGRILLDPQRSDLVAV